MDAVNAVLTVPLASSAAASVPQTSTPTPLKTHAVNVNQSNTHSGWNSLNTTTNSNSSSNSNSNINIGVSSNSSSNSNSSCCSSSTSSNSSGYGSTTTTPTNNYDLQQQTTPTTTPVPTTPVAIAEPIIPVANVAAVTPFYSELVQTHNLEIHQLHGHHQHHAQQQLQQQQHHVLPPSHPQLAQNHLQANVQQQQQYLSRQQYYSTYDYQQPAPTHNLSDSPAVAAAAAAYNVGVAGPCELSSSLYQGAGQYKSSNLTGAINYQRSTGLRTNAVTGYQQHQQQQQQQNEQQQSKGISQQTQQFSGGLASSKQRSSSLIGNSTSTNTSKPQAAATPFYAQPLIQSHSNSTAFYDNLKHKMPLEYHDTYSNPSAATASSYHQHQKYYAAAKSQLKEANYGSPTNLNSKTLYPNTGNFFTGPTASHGLSSASAYDKYMYPHTAGTGYTAAGHLGNETPPDISNYRKTVMANTMNSPSWPWGIDYASGNSRTIPPPASHLPTATVAPTHATYLAPSPTALARDPYYMGHDKYGMKYDKYTASTYQQSYVSPPATRHHMWPSTPHASNLPQLNERHLLATGPPTPPSHGLHATSYFSSNSTSGLNSRQSCCTQPYQPQSCYYPPSHPVPPRLPHNQPTAVTPSSAGYLSAQQPLGQSPHLNALSASCKYGGVITDYGNGNKLKNSNDLFLNTHHYDNNPSSHNYGNGSGHGSQHLYASNAHQSVAHGPTPASILTHDPLNAANPASYTNDLSLTASNFDNYHTHLDTHLNPQTLAGIHSQQPPPPAYGPMVTKRALLDYRKPIQPQPPPTIAEECFTTLTSRDHYNEHELLNTPETTTSFGEYETQQDNNASISSYTHSSEVLNDTDKSAEESNKNLSLRDFIANWNDDEDEFQNNEELNFDQSQVIDEVLQIAPVEQEAVAAVEEPKEVHKRVEDIDTQALSETDVNQYANLPDIVIDIKKSNNVNNSITTPSTSPTPTSLNLNNFDVEKELDELKLKKPTQQELTKDLNDIKNTQSVTTPQLSPCKNLTIQLSFEDLNLEPTNKTVLNTMTTTRLTNNQSSELSELSDHYFKDIEGYESGNSRNSNESAFEKEYETFINKITGDTVVNKSSNEKTLEKEIDFEQNFQDFSKFYKRKRKLKEDELKTSLSETQSQKKLKTNAITKVNNSNFPQVYTKKSRNRFNKIKQKISQKRKPLSVFYKIIHSIRRYGLCRLKRAREYMTELKEKHLPLIKRQSIKNDTHKIAVNLFNPNSLKTLCILAINTNEFRQCLMFSSAEEQATCIESEEKHVCADPTCETCEVIKSLMESESFEASVIQQPPENISQITALLCEDGNTEPIIILNNVKDIVDFDFAKQEPTMISKIVKNVQYSKEIPSESKAKDLEPHSTSASVIKSLLNEDVNFKTETDNVDSQHQFITYKSEPEFGLQNWCEQSNSPFQNLKAKENSKIPLQPVSETVANCNLETSPTENNSLNTEAIQDNSGAVDSELVPQTKLSDEENSNDSTDKVSKISRTSLELNEISTETKNVKTNDNEPISATKNQESESEYSDSSDSDTDNSSSNSDDESINDSHIKSEKNDSSSDSGSDSESEYEDENGHYSLKQSYRLENISLEQNAANKEVEEKNKSFGLTKSENIRQSLKSNEHKVKQSDIFNQTDMKRNNNTDSYSEDECIPERRERIVIRIKKPFSFSPNQSDFKEEHYSDSCTESESEKDDISLKESEIISKKQKNSMEDLTSEKTVKSRDESDNNTESESEDYYISENRSEVISITLKLSPKQKDSIQDSEKSVIPHSNNPTESESESDHIYEKEFENISSSIKLSPKSADFMKDNAQNQLNEDLIPRQQNSEESLENYTEIENELECESEDSTEVPLNENQSERESENVNISENKPEMILLPLKLSQKHHAPPKSFELHEDDVMDDNLEKKTNQSLMLKNSKFEVTSEKSKEMFEDDELAIQASKQERDPPKLAEVNTKDNYNTESEFEDDESDNVSMKSDEIAKETYLKKSAQLHMEVDNHIEIESKGDSISDNDCKNNFSDSDNCSNSEYETEDEDVTLEPIKISNNSMPIVISDNYSLDISDANNEIQKSGDTLQQPKSDTELKVSKNSEGLLFKPVGNEILENSQVQNCNEDSNFLSNTTDLQNVVDDNFSVTITQNTEENIFIDSKSLEELKSETEEVEKRSTNTHISKEFLPLESVEVNKSQVADNKNSCEKCISVCTSSSADSDQEMEVKLSTEREAESKDKQQMISEPILQELINSKTNYKSLKCENESNKCLERSENSNSPKTDENSLKTPDYVSDVINDYYSEKSKSPVSSQPDIQLLPTSEATIKNQNTLKENSRFSKIFFEQGDQKKDKTETYVSISETISGNLNTFAGVIPNIEASNDLSNLQNENIVVPVNSGIPEVSKNLVFEDFKRKETIGKIIETKESNILEKVSNQTADTFKETSNGKDSSTVSSTNLETVMEEPNMAGDTILYPKETISANITKDTYSVEITDKSNLFKKTHGETPATAEEIHCEQQCADKDFTEDCKFVKETNILESETFDVTTVDNAGSITEKSDSSETITKEFDISSATDNKPSETLKKMLLRNGTDAVLISEAETEEFESLEKVPSPQISEEISNQMDTTTESISTESESRFNPLIDPHCGRPSIKVTETTPKDVKTIYKTMSEDSDILEIVESQIPENRQNISDIGKTVDKNKISESENISKITAYELNLSKEASRKHLESLEQVAVEKEADLPTLTSEIIAETTKLLEEHDIQIPDKSENTLEYIETNKESLDGSESNDESIFTESKTVSVNDVDILEKEQSVTTKHYATVSITSASISLDKEKDETTDETIIEPTETLDKEINQESENIKETSDSIESLNNSTSSENLIEKPMEDKLETLESYEEEFGFDHQSRLEDNNETSEKTENNNQTFSKLEVSTGKPDSLIEENIGSSQQTKSGEKSQAVEIQTGNLECNLIECLSDKDKIYKEKTIQEVGNDNSESNKGQSGSNIQTVIKDDELVSVKIQTSKANIDKHQAGNLELHLNESLSETVLNKDSVSQGDLSGDFYGFKNQSSFEDESEDFHGFEDLAEVTRIRQEIENLTDDSAANDGFVNYGILNRDLLKSSTTSLTASTCSEINELEALEKELSQHQPEMEMEDDDKETDEAQIESANSVVSTNDIEQIKQMLESDEEQQRDVEDKVKEQEDKNKDKFVENSKNIAIDIISSVNSIIPKLSDLCRAVLNSSLNSDSNLAQNTETCTFLVEREQSVEEALAEMYRQAGVLLSDPEDCDNDAAPSGDEEAHDVLLFNLQEILNDSDNNDVYVLQCDMNENVLNVEEQHNDNTADDSSNAERVNTIQFIGILDTENSEPQIHIISSDSESEVIILSDDEPDFGYRSLIARQERVSIPFINDDVENDNDSLLDISTIHHEEIVPDNLNKFLQEEFYKYLHEKYVQRNISKYYHANRVLKKYKKRFVKTRRQ